MGKKLGFYAITVVFGLVLHGLFILPAMYFFITKKSPIVYIRGILQALLIALATSSRYRNVYSFMFFLLVVLGKKRIKAEWTIFIFSIQIEIL